MKKKKSLDINEGICACYDEYSYLSTAVLNSNNCTCSEADLEHVTMLDLSTTDQKEINNNTLHLKLSLKAAEIHSLT